MINAIINFLEINPNLGTAGQPLPDEFAGIHAAGYEVVINLVPASSPDALPDEEALVKALGMEYIHIPVIWTEPTAQDLDRFFAAMDHNRVRKVFAHCVLNMRVSVFVYLYRVLRLGAAPEAAWQSVEEIWQPEDVWQQFIDEQMIRLASSRP